MSGVVCIKCASQTHLTLMSLEQIALQSVVKFSKEQKKELAAALTNVLNDASTSARIGNLLFKTRKKKKWVFIVEGGSSAWLHQCTKKNIKRMNQKLDTSLQVEFINELYKNIMLNINNNNAVQIGDFLIARKNNELVYSNNNEPKFKKLKVWGSK